MKKYYKVISKNFDSKISYASVGIGMTVEYFENKWAKPILEGSKLFCFDSLESAQDWLNQGNGMLGYEIWECKVENPIKAAHLISYVSAQYIKDYWNNEDMRSDFLKETPKGTIWADKIMLLTQIS